MVLDAARSNNIVSNMFPGALRDRVLLNQKRRDLLTSRQTNNGGEDNELSLNHDDIMAELHPEASVIFADSGLYSMVVTEGTVPGL